MEYVCIATDIDQNILGVFAAFHTAMQRMEQRTAHTDDTHLVWRLEYDDTWLLWAVVNDHHTVMASDEHCAVWITRHMVE
jgi:hypothetical protein